MDLLLFRRVLRWGLAFAFIALSWLTIGPQRFGGPVSYVITAGSSMEPVLNHGDLIVVRRADRYEVGDVLAYRNPGFNSPILHRAVDRAPDGFVMKGDNNDWLDHWRPQNDEIIGKQWLVISGGGRFVRALLSPIATALWVFVLSFLGFRSLGGRRKGCQDADPDEVPAGELSPAGKAIEAATR